MPTAIGPPALAPLLTAEVAPFSITRTLAPAFEALTAAVNPAAPAPTITISTVFSIVSPGLLSVAELSDFKDSTFPPACVTQSATASNIAFE